MSAQIFSPRRRTLRFLCQVKEYKGKPAEHGTQISLSGLGQNTNPNPKVGSYLASASLIYRLRNLTQAKALTAYLRQI